jgi:signal transduction histidine kinase
MVATPLTLKSWRAIQAHFVGIALEQSPTLAIAATLLGFAVFAAKADSPAREPRLPALTNAADVHDAAPGSPAIACEVNLEGVVVWTNANANRFLIEDQTGVLPVEIHFRSLPALRPGARVRLTGKGVVSSATLKQTVVENDGLHAVLEKLGAIYLSAGQHPIRAEWFNGPDRYHLQVDYSGPGFARQTVPSSALFRLRRADETNRLNGLAYQCFDGRWERLPDFSVLQPTATGTSENFDIPVSARKENVAVTFSGYLSVPREGVYTFWTTSDDGSRLSVGEASLNVQFLGTNPPLPARRILPGQIAGKADDGHWAETEGLVTFTHADPSGVLQVEVSAGTNRVYVELNDGGAAPPLFSKIRAHGVCSYAELPHSKDIVTRLTLPGRDQIEILAPSLKAAHGTITNLSALVNLAETGSRILCPIHLEGQVLAANTARGLLTFFENSVAALFEMDLQGRVIQPGQKATLEGNCLLLEHRLILANPVLVDNDGLHQLAQKTGTAYLSEGKHALHVYWFNRLSPASLEVYYEGPGLARQRIPDEVLFQPALNLTNGAIDWRKGVHFRCFEGDWGAVPNSNLLNASRQGESTNFDIAVASRTENVGIEFTTFISLPREGLFTFSTFSDDGSVLLLDEQTPQLELGAINPMPVPKQIAVQQILQPGEDHQWAEVEGTVTFVSQEAGALMLELTSGTGRTRIQIPDANPAGSLLLLNGRARISGICQSTYTIDGQKVAGGMLTPGWQHLKLLEIESSRWSRYPITPIQSLTAVDPSSAANKLVHIQGNILSTNSSQVVIQDETGRIAAELMQQVPKGVGTAVEAIGSLSRSGTNVFLRFGYWRDLPGKIDASGNTPLLTTVEQVKRLSREEAQRGWKVRIRGVVTAPQIQGFFIQDSTWSIYVRLQDPSVGVPQTGEYCEVEGTTFAEFAPNIRAERMLRLGVGTLPEPLHPTWDQLINGSLDTQFVELQGIVTSAEPDGLALLTRAGKVKVQLSDADPRTLKQYESALIRVRGCVIPGRDLDTQQVELGRIRLANFSITVDEPAPRDVFALGLKHASDLLLFDPKAGAIERVKIAGQVLAEHAGEFFMAERTNGVRFVSRQPVTLSAGDLVELVGFPEMGGPSPVLREATVRKTGTAALPLPRRLPPKALLSRRYDSTLVQVEARLAGISVNRSDQLLECQAGPRPFIARLNSKHGMVRGISPDSQLQLTGVYVGHGGDVVSGQDVDSFELLINSPADVKVLKQPSWWSIRHTLSVVAGMSVVILAALVWISMLHRRVEERSRQLTIEIQRREQTERQRALEEERTRIARDLHDDLGATLTQIRFLSALESRDALVPETNRVRMSQVSEKSRAMVTSLDEIVWAVNPANDSLPSLATYLCQFAEEFLRATPIRCRLDVDESLPKTPLTSELRHNVFLVVREALNNIAKHSEATEVWLRIQFRPQLLRISIEDNGRGFLYLTSSAMGEGLANMRRRLEKIGGRFECETQPGSGTICRIELPLLAVAEIPAVRVPPAADGMLGDAGRNVEEGK